MTNQRPKIDYTSCDHESLRSAMLELARERLPEWTDHSPNDFGVTLVELFASMLDANFYALDRVAGESYLETAQERRSVVNLLRLLGYELRPPLPAHAALTLAFEVPPQPPQPPWLVTIKHGSRFTTNAKATGTAIGFQYMRPDLTINVGQLPTATIDGKPHRVFKSLPVVQVDQFVEDLLGSSDGSPGQRFPLAKKPLIDGTLVIAVGNEVWTPRDSLLTSKAADKHFMVRRDENDVVWVEFGDGSRGQPPPRGRKNITAKYYVGGGAKGNVPVRTITQVFKLDGVNPHPKVYNETPGNGGAEHEPIAEAVMRAPRMYRSMGRAVTVSDYETHALWFGAAKARARVVGNRVDLIIAPPGGGFASDVFKDDLTAYLEPRRMLTSALLIDDPTYVDIEIKIALSVEPYYYLNEVKARVQAAVRDIWSFEKVDFGETLYVSKIYEAIESVEGVAGVTVEHFSRKNGVNEIAGKLELDDRELPRYEGIPDSNITASGGKPQ